ncbi:MAG: hypothetical protein AAFV51_14920, partial [Pseudomonadota bacterium]
MAATRTGELGSALTDLATRGQSGCAAWIIDRLLRDPLAVESRSSQRAQVELLLMEKNDPRNVVASEPQGELMAEGAGGDDTSPGGNGVVVGAGGTEPDGNNGMVVDELQRVGTELATDNGLEEDS